MTDIQYSIRSVAWIDSAIMHRQVDITEFPEPVLIHSVGYLLKETEEYIVLARDDMSDGEFRGVLAIPKIAIRNITRLS